MPPKATLVAVEARVEPLTGPLPSIGWRWDPETDILSGSFKGNRKSGGLTGTVELTDDEGSVAVLDVNNGVICGLDVVVWPEVTTIADLKVPSQLTDGRVVVPIAAVSSRRRVGGSGYHPFGPDQFRRECLPSRASAPGARSKSCVSPTISTSKSTRTAGWPASG